MVTINVYDKSQVDAIAAGKANTADVYNKSQVDTLVAEKMDDVSTSGASEGDVLTLDASLNPIWQSGGSGGGKTIVDITSLSSLRTFMLSMTPGDQIVGTQLGSSSTSFSNFVLTCLNTTVGSGYNTVILTGTSGAGAGTLRLIGMNYDDGDYYMNIAGTSTTVTINIFNTVRGIKY